MKTSAQFFYTFNFLFFSFRNQKPKPIFFRAASVFQNAISVFSQKLPERHDASEETLSRRQRLQEPV